MNTIFRILISVALLLAPIAGHAQSLETSLKQLLKNLDFPVGVAAVCGDQVTVHQNNERYPLASVMKLPIALCTLQKMEGSGTSLDIQICIEKSRMIPGTYSPLRDSVGISDANLTMRQAIAYCVQQSDNIVCDWLIDYCGGASAIQEYVARLGLRPFRLRYDERGLHADIRHEFKNWSHPLTIARLLQKLDSGEILSNEHRTFLLDVMSGTTTGTDKIKAGLPAGTPIAHKTGHSDRLADGSNSGRKIADNDAAIITLPDGRHLYLVVFVKLSDLSDEDNASLIAKIAEIVYNAAARQNPFMT
jgi:beta-lactamase class A